jgi:Fe-S-cluster-containing dehydrogenase component/formate-dependent nitrite reductase membrane component NrfD
MNYGFLIRNDRCIGCHACSTACKSENDVPVGVNRTWVKSVERGRYPDVRRSFQVTRCNHCANPPCVRICPVTAMYQRADGIVEFDPDRCIGCKACLQACPYDAIYIDPDTGTAAKCHYCAHRVEMSLEPACVVVCPEHAIISGDMDDPLSEISRMLAREQVTVRKPEQGTAPKLFYVDGDAAAMVPTATERAPVSFAAADVTAARGGGSDAGRAPGGQGTPAGGPIHVGGGRMAGELLQASYNAQHKVPWHWPVPAYLVTKGIAAGLFLLLAMGDLLGLVLYDARAYVVMGFLSLLFLGVTTGLLVYDLERPERFLTVLTRAQWSSWLARGAFLLVGFSLLASAWWVAELAAWMGWPGAGPAEALRAWAFWLGAPLATGVAVYTAFLFGQAEGRDLWQSPLLPAHLLVQAFLAGSALILWWQPLLDLPGGLVDLARIALVASLVADVIMIVGGELGMAHASGDAALAAHDITRGRFRVVFLLGVLFLGHAVPLALLVWYAGPATASAAGLATLVGLYLYEHAFVMAPQDIPNS